MPTRLHKEAGTRIEPPVSEPSVAGTSPAATEVAPPLVEPPVIRLGSQALRGWPVCGLWPVMPSANSTMLSRPQSMAPAASSLAITVAVVTGRWPLKMVEPYSLSSPARWNMSLCASGTPCNGPSTSPRALASSAARGCCERLVGVEPCQRVQRRSPGLQRFQRRPRRLDRADLATGDGPGQLGSPEIQDSTIAHGRHTSPR